MQADVTPDPHVAPATPTRDVALRPPSSSDRNESGRIIRWSCDVGRHTVVAIDQDTDDYGTILSNLAAYVLTYLNMSFLANYQGVATFWERTGKPYNGTHDIDTQHSHSIVIQEQ